MVMNFNLRNIHRVQDEIVTLDELNVSKDIIIKNARLFSPQDGLDQVGDVLINAGGIIEKIGRDIDGLMANVIDGHDLVLTTAFVDLHCHLREPGQTDKETIQSGLKAAAAGGFGVVCAMPNTSPTQDNAEVLQFVLNKTQESPVRLLPVAAMSQGRQGQQLTDFETLCKSGAVAFSDDGCSLQDDTLAAKAFETAASGGYLIMEHCEDALLTEGGQVNEGMIATRLGLKGIPAVAEENIIKRDIDNCRRFGTRLHICHISTSGAVALVRAAKKEGLKVTAEVTPHHLALDEKECLDYNTNAKVNPPLRAQKDIDALIIGLNDGTIDAIATDHAPHTAHEKDCEFAYAPFGISGLETAFALVNGLITAGRISLATAIKALSVNPSAILDLPCGMKVGQKANLVLLDLTEKWPVEVKDFKSRGHNTPLQGRKVQGRVKMTIADGEVAYKEIH